MYKRQMQLKFSITDSQPNKVIKTKSITQPVLAVLPKHDLPLTQWKSPHGRVTTAI